MNDYLQEYFTTPPKLMHIKETNRLLKSHITCSNMLKSIGREHAQGEILRTRDNFPENKMFQHL